jgi:hypothetical protein
MPGEVEHPRHLRREAREDLQPFVNLLVATVFGDPQNAESRLISGFPRSSGAGFEPATFGL